MRLIFVCSMAWVVGLAFTVTTVAAVTPAPSASPANLSADDANPYLHLRDPFLAPHEVVVTQVERRGLAKYSLSELKLAGIITGPDRKKAMLMGPDKSAYFVSERMKVGNRDGIVKRITADRVVIVEKVMNVLGKMEPTETVLTLPEAINSVLDVGSSIGTNLGSSGGSSIGAGFNQNNQGASPANSLVQQLAKPATNALTQHNEALENSTEEAPAGNNQSLPWLDNSAGAK